MKKIIVALVVLPVLFAFAGCPADDPSPQSMTFKAEDDSKTFTIYSNNAFKVVFLDDSAQGYTLGEGDWVAGNIKIYKGAWNKYLEGSAEKMSSSNENLNTTLAPLEVPVIMTYTEAEDGSITSVKIEFKNHQMADTASGLMGGTYTRQ